MLFKRKKIGSNGSKKIRQESKIPAIIYGDGKKAPNLSLLKLKN